MGNCQHDVSYSSFTGLVSTDVTKLLTGDDIYNVDCLRQVAVAGEF